MKTTSKLPLFAKALRRCMDAKEWTAYRLSKEAQVDQGFVSHLLRGTKAPSWDAVCKLADALGVDVGEFRR